MSDIPETRFASVGDDRVAFQLCGQGPHDLVITAGQWGNVDSEWEMPGAARFFRQLAAFARLIRFDPRGVGLSDPRPGNEADVARCWAEDLLAVMDQARCAKASVVAWIDGGMFAIPFAANHPERVEKLVLFNTVASYAQAADYPEGNSPEVVEKYLAFTRKYFGTDRWSLANSPSLRDDPHAMGAMSKACRAMSSPRAAAESFAIQQRMDVRSLLDRVRCPTLVLGRSNCAWAPLSQTRYLAERIAGARFVELPGTDLPPYTESSELVCAQVEEFVTGQRVHGEIERALVTILFTDIVGSTALAARLGDGRWRTLLDRHDQIVRDQLALFGGTLVERTGDGTLATFVKPSRAIECAHALHQAMGALELALRAGVHTAEVELRGDGRIGGINVHWGARVMAQAAAGEILVSHVVHGMLIGSSHAFEDRGIHALKGVPGQWPLYAVATGQAAGT